DANKRLQDTNDVLRELLDIGVMPYDKQTTYGDLGKRGSIIGDYLQAGMTPMGFMKTKQRPSGGTEEEYSVDIAKYRQMSLMSVGMNKDDNYKMDSLGDDMDSGFSTIQDPFESEVASEENVDEENESLERKIWSTTRKDSTSSIHTQSSSQKSSFQQLKSYFKPQIHSDSQTVSVFARKAESDILEHKLPREYSNTDAQSEGGTPFNQTLNQLLNVDSEPASNFRPHVSSTSSPVSSIADKRVPTPQFSFKWSPVRPNKIPSPGPQTCSDINRKLANRDEQAAIAGGDGQSQIKTLKEVREQVTGDSDSFEPTGPPDRTYKVVFIGDAAVGKSSMIIRISKGLFVGNITSTLGVDFQMKSLRVDNRNIAVQLWDTAGQERFRSITQSYFRKADGIMLVYDCTSEHSFLNVRQWMDAID
ncbi:ras and EF-hand domain-containing protein homolog, partial [Limulus polyphemus]|uniref:Ras and EF-hand domain-containing protein homolog n=1 Tax=Limulus polyphemus TaxID=6850 RepID=A0ABM1RY63_LIMPO